MSDLTRVAESIIEELGERRVVLLRGSMGAGKTTLVSRIAKCNAENGNIFVRHGDCFFKAFFIIKTERATRYAVFHSRKKKCACYCAGFVCRGKICSIFGIEHNKCGRSFVIFYFIIHDATCKTEARKHFVTFFAGYHSVMHGLFVNSTHRKTCMLHK